MLALAFGSLGDILLEFAQFGFIFFAIGAAAFLVGHLIYVVTFLQIIGEISKGESEVEGMLKLKPLLITIWIVFFVFSFWSMGTIMHSLESGSVMLVIVPVYGTFLTLLVMASLFFFFMVRNQP